MEARMHGRLSRREAMTGVAISGAAAGAGLGVWFRTGSAQRAISSTGGIAGGGLIEGPDAAVHFSLFGTRLPGGEDEEWIFSGKIRLVDPLQAWRMESVEIASYGPVDGEDPNLREFRGTMLVTLEDAEAEYPFVLRAVDGGGPTEGLDTLTLAVGAAAATPESGGDELDVFSYELNGTVSAGDITLVEFALAEE